MNGMTENSDELLFHSGMKFEEEVDCFGLMERAG
jgi:hypothetical protein